VLGGGGGPGGGSARGATDAGLYDPAADRWRPIAGVPADLPEVWPWIHAWVDPHGDALMLTTFGAIHVYFVDAKRGALEEVSLPPELQGRVDPVFAFTGKRLLLWGGRSAPPSEEAWSYEPR
jgi:hypothetical protein